MQRLLLVDDDEIEPIIKLIDENDIIDYSRVLIENSNIFVKDGHMGQLMKSQQVLPLNRL